MTTPSPNAHLYAKPFHVLLYDRERYAGENWAPGYARGMVRFALSAFRKRSEALFAELAWTASAETYAQIRSMVPTGGHYMDRTHNWPTPMVPVESWAYDAEQPPPIEVKQ